MLILWRLNAYHVLPLVISSHLRILCVMYECPTLISQAVNWLSGMCLVLCCTILNVSPGYEMRHTHTHTPAETSLLYVCSEQVTGALQQYSMEWKMAGGRTATMKATALCALHKVSMHIKIQQISSAWKHVSQQIYGNTMCVFGCLQKQNEVKLINWPYFSASSLITNLYKHRLARSKYITHSLKLEHMVRWRSSKRGHLGHFTTVTLPLSS